VAESAWRWGSPIGAVADLSGVSAIEGYAEGAERVVEPYRSGGM
jgi:hypothetical protein